ncbi:alpha/beta fold hydrolase [Bacillus sp. NP157]|nr:alpha/beta fold hydrolase [Bacillus sp. NP157]
MWVAMWLGLALGGSVQAGAVSADATTKALLQRAQYEQVRISPDGALLAVAYRDGDGTLVTVLDRKTMAPVQQVNPGKGAEVQVLRWLGSEQLVISANRHDATYAMPLVDPRLYLLNIHDSHPKILPDNFVGTIHGDDKHVLIKRFSTVGGELRWALATLDTTHLTAMGDVIAVAPHGVGDFVVDHAGHARFVSGVDDNGEQMLYVRKDGGDWTVLNDSKATHVFVGIAGIDRENRFAYLDTEQRGGPDVVERYSFADGSREVVLKDAESDPLSTLMSLDQVEPIGATFGPGRPVLRFFDPASPDARVTTSLAAAFPDGIASIESANADGTLLVVMTHGDRDPGTFYLFDKTARKAQLLFRTRPWIDPAAQASSDAFTFKARDGLPLSGFITLPTNGATPPPLVVLVHGGPYYIQDEWDYDREVQLLAQHGYAVLRVNFRGSGGSGREFVERGYRQWGAAMQDDVTDATHWAIDHHLADGRRVCIFGGSYGGYAALMGAAREPGLYRCAIGMAGVYDLSRMYTWGDIHRLRYGPAYLHRVIGTDKAELAARSPVQLASAITIPVLLGHGALDGRAPVEHARALRDALTKAGHPPLYREYPYEGHGLADEAHNEDFYARVLQFLDAQIGAASHAEAVASPP